MLGYLYARQSADNRASIEQQEQLGEGWFAAERIEVTGRYRDGVSASRFASQARAGWPRLLSDLKRTDQSATLWLWESSRGDRDPVTWMAFLAACREHGVLIRVHSDGRTYDMRNARDWRTLAEDGIDNAYESEKTQRRVLRAVASRAVEGRPHGRNTFGYLRVYDERTGKLAEVVEHPESGPLVRGMARRVLAGETLYAVARDLTARGVATPESGRWNAAKLRRVLATPPLAPGLSDAKRRVDSGESPSTVAADLNAAGIAPPFEAWDPTMIRSILTNPSYTGRRYRNGAEVGPAMWPALIAEPKFLRLRAVLSAPERRSTREAAVKHLLTGIARCGACGGRMRVRKNRANHVYCCVQCFGVGRLQEPVDYLVTDTVVSFLARPDAADILALPDGDAEAEAAFAEIAEKQARLDAFEVEATAGRLTAGRFARIEATLLAEIEAAKTRVTRATLAPVLAEVIGPDAAARWGRLSMSQRRAVVAGLMTVEIMPQGKGNRVFDPKLIRRTWHHEARADGRLGAEA